MHVDSIGLPENFSAPLFSYFYRFRSKPALSVALLGAAVKPLGLVPLDTDKLIGVTFKRNTLGERRPSHTAESSWLTTLNHIVRCPILN